MIKLKTLAVKSSATALVCNYNAIIFSNHTYVIKAQATYSVQTKSVQYEKKMHMKIIHMHRKKVIIVI